MIIYVFGNPDLPQDSLPLRLLPQLRKRLPQHEFAVQDPHEEWSSPPELTVIDTVLGIAEPRVFGSLAEFEQAPRLTVHDFDALTNLRWLQKLGRLQGVRVLGLPPDLGPDRALTFLAEQLG